ncbi:hypothetical protein, partial [Pseudomonas syringae group genomosp. 7]|uniref:hypothetical protein n=1 Tax=Pseudomonas syringae group genomosp. 7 TaxID=251699 RepID=UPI00376FC491
YCIILDLGREDGAQQTFAVLRDSKEIAIELLVRVVKAAQLSMVLDLIVLAASNAGAGDFL